MNAIKSYVFGISALSLMHGAVNFMSEESIVELDANLDSYADFELLPKSSYPGECVLAEKRVSDAGNEYYYTNWKIAVEDYPEDYDPENAPEGTTLNYSRVQVPKSTDRRSITAAKRLMSAMGLTLKTKVINPDEWIGKKARLVVGVSTFNGERRNQIDRIESIEA